MHSWAAVLRGTPYMLHSFRPGVIAAACTLLSLLVTPPALAQHSSGLPHNVPNFCATTDLRSVRSGVWSDPGTWSAGRIPRAGDRVGVASGTTVTYDQVSDAALNCIGVDGRFIFRRDADTRLTVGTIIVRTGGELEIGTAANPVAASVSAEVVIADQPLDLTSDPEQFGTGLIGFGKVTIGGAARTPTFLRTVSEPRSGQTSLALEASPLGWRPGDRLILPDTRHLKVAEYNNYVPQWEELSLGGISGASAQLNSGLRFDHRGARDGNGTLEFLPHVGNLSRNVIVRSQNPSGVRGHVIFIGRAEIDIRYAAFRDLGRTTIDPLNNTTFDGTHQVTHIGTNQIGRYSLHLHHVTGPVVPLGAHQFRLIGNAVENAPKWGIAIHNSHFGLIQQNVIYNANGASLMTEDGNESFNLIDSNFAVRGYGVGGREGGGREGVGFYLRGPNNYVRGNVAANFRSDALDAAYGFKMFFKWVGNIKIPVAPGADVSVEGQYTLRDAYAMRLLDFSDNEVYGATDQGLTYWWVGTFGELHRPNAETSVIRSTRIWHVHNKAVFSYESNQLVIDGLTIRGTAQNENACCNMGVEQADYFQRNFILRNADIQGMHVGVNVSTVTAGTPLLIENAYLRNYTNVSIATLWTSSYRADWLKPRTVILSNIRFDSTPAGFMGTAPTAIRMAYSATPVRNLVQLDRVFVYAFNGSIGDDFRVYYPESRPDFVVPQVIRNDDGTPRLEAAPEAGLTNQQLTSRYGMAIGGAVAPCTTTRASVIGLTCSGIPSLSSVITLPPTPPRPSGLRIAGPG